MFKKITDWVGGSKNNLEAQYMKDHDISYHPEQGYCVNGMVVNTLSERLEYFSNRRLNRFDDLAALYLASILINEKIDLEIATGNYVQRLQNNENNLREFKAIIEKLNHYYREFKRDK
ncbi:hypothetical protein ABLT94_02165 [Acinetobacter soli]|uniref:hypothetical protein n=1 Tax=Acinetobacter soli TaxID=487316 RepID=UPI0032B347A4